jgi:hypothetical protein
MRRQDFIFCIGFEGSTAIIDGRLLRRYGSRTTRELAEAGFFKQALSSAIFSGNPQELEDVLALFNKGVRTPVGSVEELKRIFSVFGVPEGVKKVKLV